MVVSSSGRTIDVRLVQSWKTTLAISVTELGIVNDTSAEQSLTALAEIAVTVFGIITVFNP